MTAITETGVTVVLEADKVTKRTLRFVETGEEQRVGQIYMPQSTCAHLGIPVRVGALVEITVRPASAE